MKRITSVACCVALAITGCATKASNIAPQYVSPARYANLTCDQVREQLVGISLRVRQVSGRQDRKATRDSIAAGIGVIIFWPALVFLMSDDHAAELSRLKGEYEALGRTAKEKDCPVAAELSSARASFQ